MEHPPPRSIGRHRDRSSLTSLALAAATGEDLAASAPAAPAPSVRRARLSLSRQSARILLAVVGVVCAAVLVWLMRPRASAVPTPALAAEGASSPSPARVEETQDTRIVVYVSGAVVSPGVVTLDAGARVTDAVDAVGGLTDKADRTLINLAEPLADGVHVHVLAVGEAPTPAAPAGSTGAGGKVHLNSASAEDLQAVPGIGPATAAKIVQWRTEHGPFATLNDLTSIDGIGPKTVEKFRDVVVVP